MVEAAGIEPASEKVRTTASTRLARSFFYLALPTAERQMVEEPAPNFRPAPRGVTARLSRICVVSSGRLGQATREPRGFIKLRKRACYRQLLVVHLICEEWNLGVLLSPLPFRRIQFAPIPETL